MKALKAVTQQIASQTLILAIGGAVFLSACGKNSGFHTSPISAGQMETQLPPPNKPLSIEQETKPAETPEENKHDEVKINPAAPSPSNQPSPSPEFKIEQEPSLIGTVKQENQNSFEFYRMNEDMQATNPTPAEVVKAYPLAWEAKSNPERKAWSDYTMKVVEAQFSKLDQATDANRFCPNYKLLENKYKKIFWAMLISEIAFHESSWNPTARSRESTMGIDGVTKEQVHSEGLLQLSYQDSQWLSYCQFDWSKDKSLSKDDPKKTIFNPYTNLSCGIRILAEQVAKRKQIILQKDVYWSVLRQDGKYAKFPAMAQDIRKRLDFCN